MSINVINKNIIITGASKGIGENLAYTLSEYGANVILLSRNVKNLKNIVDKINLKNKKNTSSYYKLDISIESDVVTTFELIFKNHKKIDVLINNAGITSDNIVPRMTSDQWLQVINTNLNGCFYCCRSIANKCSNKNNVK